jgi:DNA-directed RNA polymerase specialized sigma24 family protein
VKKFKFEEKIEAINLEIQKRKGKWFLNSISSIDFDDISQILRAHINKKWHLWDQEKPLEPWLNTVISNQIKNQIRNNYGSFAKPCLNCPFNESVNSEENICSYTKSGEQDKTCPVYAKWAKSKKYAYDVKLPKSFDCNDFQIGTNANNNDLEKAAVILHQKMKDYLTVKQYKVYTLLYVDNKEDADVARVLGYKTSEKGRTPGYRQIKNLKKHFKEVAEKIMQKEDVFYG